MSEAEPQRHSELFVYRRLTDVQRAQFENDGYLVVGETLTVAGLETLRSECMAAWNASKEGFHPDRTWLQNSLLANVHHYSEVARRFYFEGPLVDIAEQLIGPNIKAATSQLTFKLRGNTMEFGWHQDNGYGELEPYNAISTLTAFDDADEENGCLRVVPGSHQREQLAVEHSIADKKAGVAIELKVDNSEVLPVPMRAGQSLLLNCWTLHRSAGNLSKERDRRVLFMRYADADAVEVYNGRRPRLGRLLRGETKFPEVEAFEADLG
ncbi:MAG: phytanoyl-CoA dioxygenase family protein [Planctomycetes bacterium]|nr:phytanoyl-CoA dioxygenase family protein [Planctomycetota bacterium]